MSSEKKKCSAEIEVSIYPASTMFFRLDSGTAEAGSLKFELSIDIGTNVPIIRLPDGRWAVFSWEALLRAAQSAGEKVVAGLGQAYVRDPDNICDVFKPGAPSGSCFGDGHYLCQQCEFFAGSVPLRDPDTKS